MKYQGKVGQVLLLVEYRILRLRNIEWQGWKCWMN